jgi:hypothetical protein
MERVLIKRTNNKLQEKETLSFYTLELENYSECFKKFFEEKDKLKYNQFEKVEIVDKFVNELYLKWEDKQIYKK